MANNLQAADNVYTVHCTLYMNEIRIIAIFPFLEGIKTKLLNTRLTALLFYTFSLYKHYIYISIKHTIHNVVFYKGLWNISQNVQCSHFILRILNLITMFLAKKGK